MVLSNIIRKKSVNFLDKHKLIKHIICLICSIEAEVRFILDSKLCDLSINGITSRNTYHCEDCDMRSFSKLAQLIFGSGHYCLYLQQCDFSLSQSTDLLWDCIKCCGISSNRTYAEVDGC